MRCTFAPAFCCLVAVLCVLVIAQPGSCASPPPYENYLIPCSDAATNWGPPDDPTHFDRVNERDGATTRWSVWTTETYWLSEAYAAWPEGGPSQWPEEGYAYDNEQTVVVHKGFGPSGYAELKVWTYAGYPADPWVTVISCRVGVMPSAEWRTITSATFPGAPGPYSAFELVAKCVRPFVCLQVDEVRSGHWDD